MKKRQSFVSNSSSCSFFVWIKTDKEAEEFNKIKDELMKKLGCMKLCVYNTMKDLLTYQSQIVVDKVTKGNVFSVCTGEDNEGDFRIYQLDEIYNFIYKKFRIYRDNYAHYSYGQDLPKIENLEK